MDQARGKQTKGSYSVFCEKRSFIHSVCRLAG